MYAIIGNDGRNRMAPMINDTADVTVTATELPRVTAEVPYFDEENTSTTNKKPWSVSTTFSAQSVSTSTSAQANHGSSTQSTSTLVLGLSLGLALGLLCVALATIATIFFRRYRREQKAKADLRIRYAQLRNYYYYAGLQGPKSPTPFRTAHSRDRLYFASHSRGAPRSETASRCQIYPEELLAKAEINELDPDAAVPELPNEKPLPRRPSGHDFAPNA